MARILVVEDEFLIADLLAGFLEELGHSVVGPTGDLSQALDLIATGEFDGAILDVTLGRESSYPAADALTEKQVPFAFATGHGVADMPARFQSVARLSKPYFFDDVERVAALFVRPQTG